MKAKNKQTNNDRKMKPPKKAVLAHVCLLVTVFPHSRALCRQVQIGKVV